MPGLDAIGLISNNFPSTKDWFNMGSDMLQNHISRKWSERMYQRTYDDNVKFWQLQNAYNTPTAQMERFRDAGLNPNLMYGQGSNGNAQSIPTPDVQRPEFRAPHIQGGSVDALGMLLGQADLKIKAAQADNLLAQNEDIRQSGILRMYQAQRAGFDLDFEKGTVGYSADARRLGVEKTKNDILLSTNRDAREAASNSSSLQEAAERMLSMRSQRATGVLDRQRIKSDTERLRLDNQLKQLDIDLRKQGINPNDPLWVRIVGRIVSDWFDGKPIGMGSLLPDLLPGQKFPAGPKY